MKWFLFIFIHCILYSNSNIDNKPIGEIIEIKGKVKLISKDSNLLPIPLVSGRYIFDGDIIQSKLNDEIKIKLILSGIIISVSDLSEIQLNYDNNITYVKLNYGKIFSEDTLGKNNTFSYLLTKNSKIKLSNNELWLSRSLAEKDQVFSIKDSTLIETSFNTAHSIKMGQRFTLNKTGEYKIGLITKNMIPEKIYTRLINNQKIIHEKLPFTVMNYFTNDSTIKMAFFRHNKINSFNIKSNISAVSINNMPYLYIALVPTYTNNLININYNFNTFLGLTDSSKEINNYSKLSNILAPLTIKYTSINNRLNFYIGKIDNITFGHGSLIKRYSNTINYPLIKDCGITLDYKSDAEDFTLNYFTSSIDELINNGGITGLYTTKRIKSIKKIRIGFGVVYDHNQFSSTADSIWFDTLKPKRSISAYQLNVNYELKSDLLNDIYLFSEFTSIIYPENLRYIRTEEVNWDTTLIKQGFERKTAFGILGPGIHWKIGHYKNIKIALNYSSSLYTTPFFSQTYNLERAYYIPSSILDSIDVNEPYAEDDKWNSMVKKYNTNLDSTAYYLPKDIYELLNPTKNVYNKIGLFFKYNKEYKKYYKYSLDINIMQEITNESPNNYYTLGLNLFINEGLIKKISEFNLYLNQYFTSKPFDTTLSTNNIIFGSHIKINILKNIFLKIYRHDVFYDNDLDGNNDLNTTMGISLIKHY